MSKPPAPPAVAQAEPTRCPTCLNTADRWSDCADAFHAPDVQERKAFEAEQPYTLAEVTALFRHQIAANEYDLTPAEVARLLVTCRAALNAVAAPVTQPPRCPTCDCIDPLRNAEWTCSDSFHAAVEVVDAPPLSVRDEVVKCVTSLAPVDPATLFDVLRRFPRLDVQAAMWSLMHDENVLEFTPDYRVQLAASRTPAPRDAQPDTTDWPQRFAVYAFDLDGFESLDEWKQQICRDAAEWARQRVAEIVRPSAERAAPDAMQDTARLDWLEAEQPMLFPSLSDDKKDFGFRLTTASAKSKTLGFATNLRAAIDAAHDSEKAP